MENINNNRRNKVCSWQKYLFASLLVFCQAFLLVHVHRILVAAPLSKTEPSSVGGSPPQSPLDKLPIIVDVVSIGSLSNNDSLERFRAQRATWASERWVRNFWTVTEANDYDPACPGTLTNDNVTSILQWCTATYSRQRKDNNNDNGDGGASWLQYRWIHFLGRPQWVLKKKNPVGWLCAQPRFMAGFVKAIQENYYGHQNAYDEDDPSMNNAGTTTTRMALPDYLLLVDDDTIINISQLWNTELQIHNRDAGIKYVAAGCRVRDMDLYSAFGGFGTLFSRGTLEHLTTPIVCSNTTTTTTTTTGQQQKGPYMERTSVCQRIDENLLGERPFFHNGMTLADLFGARVAAQKYSDFRSWDIGFCFHSDQYFAAFAEIYELSRNQFMEATKGSEMSHNRRFWYETGDCSNNAKCNPQTAIACHYQTAAQMYGWQREQQQQQPGWTGGNNTSRSS